MVAQVQSYVIENDAEFKAALDRAVTQVKDLRFAFMEIARDWFTSNQSIFNLQSSGLYPPLSPDYALRKTKLAGRRLPILVGASPTGGESGRLRDSISGRTAPGQKPSSDTILRIGKSELVIGTTVPYGIFHQSDAPRSKIPLRKFLFIGPEAPSSAPERVTGRLKRFLLILESEISRSLDK